MFFVRNAVCVTIVPAFCFYFFSLFTGYNFYTSVQPPPRPDERHPSGWHSRPSLRPGGRGRRFPLRAAPSASRRSRAPRPGPSSGEEGRQVSPGPAGGGPSSTNSTGTNGKQRSRQPPALNQAPEAEPPPRVPRIVLPHKGRGFAPPPPTVTARHGRLGRFACFLAQTPQSSAHCGV